MKMIMTNTIKTIFLRVQCFLEGKKVFLCGVILFHDFLHLFPPFSNSGSRSGRPANRPRYLAPTNAFRKKVVSPEAAREIRERQRQEHEYRETKGHHPQQQQQQQHRGSHNNSFEQENEQHDQRHHHHHRQQQEQQHFSRSHEPLPEEFDHHLIYHASGQEAAPAQQSTQPYRQQAQRTPHGQQTVSPPVAQQPQPQYQQHQQVPPPQRVLPSREEPQIIHRAPSQDQSLHHAAAMKSSPLTPSTTVPPPQHFSPPQHQLHSLPHQQQQQQQVPPLSTTNAAGNRLTRSQDPEYEYYEQLLKEQQQQFLNYQLQSSQVNHNRPPANHSERISTLKNLIDEQQLQLQQHQQQLYNSENQNDPNIPLNPEEYNHPNYQPTSHSGQGRVASGAVPAQSRYYSDPYDNQYNNVDNNNNYNPNNESMMNQEDQEVYSLNPSYYSGKNNQKFFKTSPNRNSSSRSNQSRGRQQQQQRAAAIVRSSPPQPQRDNQKMEKAQRLLIYGVLHDVMDAKKAWERNLRR
jgi:hypothetical protein